jgi:hypothetical protein
MFERQEDLQALYPAMVHHSVMNFGSQQVLRFLQRKGAGEVKSDRRLGPDGIRVKHWLNNNSLKLYDKGSVLRSEVTINNPKDFRVFRTAESKPDGEKSWRVLRRTVADVSRRAEVCRGATHRHLQALSVVKLQTPLAQEAERLCRPIGKAGRRYRGIRPFGGDAPLLEAINRLEFAIAGFQNRDIRAQLHRQNVSPEKRRRQAAAIGRHLAMLRAHGLIRKVQGRHLYQVTAKGRRVITALLTARHANIEQLTKMAA